jgi:ABC-type transport system involved in cytochrome c biogenesis permease component
MAMDHDNRRQGPTGVWIAVGVLLLIPVVLPLLVGTYAKETPSFAGVPFYFWWQFALILVSAVCTLIAYVVVMRLERQRRGRTMVGGDRP